MKPRFFRKISITLMSVVLGISINASAQIDQYVSPIKDEPYSPQIFDIGVSLGTAFSTSSYILVEGFSGLRIGSYNEHDMIYIDASIRIAAQNGETHYIGTIGPRFQTYYENSSWGPYIRSFIGDDHYLFVGQVKDYGVVGLALGTYYSLHPATDARFEIAQGLGPIPLTFITIGFSFRLENL